MSFVYTPDPTNNPSGFTLPSDGDPKSAASVVVPFQGIADLAARCRLYLTGGLPGATLLNAMLNGTTTANGPIQGSGGLLLLSRPGETTIVLGGSIFAGGFIHRFDGSVQFVGNPTVNAGTTMFVNGHLIVAVGADEIVSGTLSVLGTQNIGSGGVVNVQSGGFLNVQSGAGFVLQNGAVGALAAGGIFQVNAGGTVNNSGVIRNASAGHIAIRCLFGLDADQTISILLADHFGAQPTALRRWTLSNSGCSGGEEMSIFNEFAPSHALELYGSDGTTLLYTLNNAPYTGVSLVNDGANSVTSWHIRSISRG